MDEGVVVTAIASPDPTPGPVPDYNQGGYAVNQYTLSLDFDRVTESSDCSVNPDAVNVVVVEMESSK